MVDHAGPRPRADEQARHPQAEAVLVHDRRNHVVVEASPVVPREPDRCRVPVGPAHRRVDQAGDVRLAVADRRTRGRVLAAALAGRDPRDGRERAVLRRLEVGRVTLDVAELAVLVDRDEPVQRVLVRRRPVAVLAGTRTVEARAGVDVIGPADVVLVQQVGDVGPSVRRVVAVAHDVLRVVQDDVRAAAHRVLRVLACRRPRRDQEQVRRQRPRIRGREQPVLQDEVIGVRPVVRDVRARVIAEDVGLVLRSELLLAPGL
jgi:hypothetical protein